jgi:hypothetical protein
MIVGISLFLLTAGASFWMGRLSATSMAAYSAPPALPNEDYQDPNIIPMELSGISPPLPAPKSDQEASSSPPGTGKAAGGPEAAEAGVARTPPRSTDITAVAKAERAVQVKRLGRPVGPDGVSYEPLHSSRQ